MNGVARPPSPKNRLSRFTWCRGVRRYVARQKIGRRDNDSTAIPNRKDTRRWSSSRWILEAGPAASVIRARPSSHPDLFPFVID